MLQIRWAVYQPLLSISCVTPHYIISPVHQSGGIFARSPVQNKPCSWVMLGVLASAACFRSFHNISIGLRSRLGLGYSNTLSFCMTHFALRFCSWTDVMTFSFRIYCYNSEFIAPLMVTSCAVLDAQAVVESTEIPLCSADVTRFSCGITVLSFLQIQHFAFQLKHSNLGLAIFILP